MMQLTHHSPPNTTLCRTEGKWSLAFSGDFKSLHDHRLLFLLTSGPIVSHALTVVVLVFIAAAAGT